MKKALIILIAIMLCMSGVYADDFITYTEKGKILEVDIDGSEIDTEVEGVQNVKLKITTGKYKGQEFYVENHISGAYIYDIPVSKGDKVLLHIEEHENGELAVYISDYVRLILNINKNMMR